MKFDKEYMEKKVGVVLVNYNGADYIAGCLDSLLVQTYKNTEILFWDNASRDSSVEIVKAHYPQIYLVESEKNYGFAKANNLAVKRLLKTGIEYVLLLNVDTVASPDLIEKLLEYANENTVTTAQTRTGKQGREISYAGGKILIDDADAVHLTMNVKHPTEVTFICGCCMMIHKEIIIRYGLFDTSYFLYYEDVDLCMRWYLNGVKMYYISEAKLWHKVCGSNNSYKFYEYYTARNRLYFAKKYKAIFSVSTLRIIIQIIKQKFTFPKKMWLVLFKSDIIAFCDYFLNIKGEIRHRL